MNPGVALPCAERPRASILIPAFDGGRLERCLTSLAASLSDRVAVEVIAVLNGAGPHLRSVAAAADGLRVIDPPVNLGFPGGGNLARAAARGEYLVVVQDDAVVAARWLDALVEVADAHPEAGLVGSVTLWPGGDRIMQAGQAMFSDGTFRDIAADEPAMTLDGRAPYAVDTLSSTGMLVPTRTWDAVGGLDEDYFPLYMVDATISRQVWARGEAVLCAPSARVEHARSSSTTPRFKTFLWTAHYAIWRERWASEIAALEPPGKADVDANQRALARAETRWRAARPGPDPTHPPAPPYDPDGGELGRLAAGIRFAGLAAEVQTRYSESLERTIAESERHLAHRDAENVRLQQELGTRIHSMTIDLEAHQAHAAEMDAELAHLRGRAQTLSAIEAGGWWRLRERLLPVLRLIRRGRRFDPGRANQRD